MVLIELSRIEMTLFTIKTLSYGVLIELSRIEIIKKGRVIAALPFVLIELSRIEISGRETRFRRL